MELLELVQEILALMASVSPPTIFLLRPGNLAEDAASQWKISLALGLKLTLEAGEGTVSRRLSLFAINVVTLQPAA